LATGAVTPQGKVYDVTPGAVGCAKTKPAGERLSSVEPIDPRLIRRRFAWRWLLPVPVGLVLGATLLAPVGRCPGDPSGNVVGAGLCGLLGFVLALRIRFGRNGRSVGAVAARTDPDIPPRSQGISTERTGPATLGAPHHVRRPWGWLWPMVGGMVLGPMAFGWCLPGGPSDPGGYQKGAALGGLLGLGIALVLRFKAGRRAANRPGPQPDPVSPLRPDTRIVSDRSTHD
jgi:hypothetical protein